MFARPTLADLLPVLQLILAANHHAEYSFSTRHIEDLAWLIDTLQFDVRRILFHLQLWLATTAVEAPAYLFRCTVQATPLISHTDRFAQALCSEFAQETVQALAGGVAATATATERPVMQAFINQIGDVNIWMWEQAAMTIADQIYDHTNHHVDVVAQRQIDSAVLGHYERFLDSLCEFDLLQPDIDTCVCPVASQHNTIVSIAPWPAIQPPSACLSLLLMR
jgi:hypothetical protein